jgi:hypothetical protein
LPYAECHCRKAPRLRLLESDIPSALEDGELAPKHTAEKLIAWSGPLDGFDRG